MLNICGFNHKVREDKNILNLQLSDRLEFQLDKEEEKFIQSLPLGTYMINGVPGSGKTEILLERAIYLAKENPKWKILILTYNKFGAYKLKERINDLSNGFENSLNGRAEKSLSKTLKNHLDKDLRKELRKDLKRNLVGDLRENLKSNSESRYDFLKNIEVRNFHSVASELAGTKKPEYIDTGDWFKELVVDVAMINVKESYDAIFIDDYQDFRESWLKLAVELCKSYRVKRNIKGDLDKNVRCIKNIFLAGDGLQNVYNDREINLKAVGIDVGSNLKFLKSSYRVGENIFNFALNFLRLDYSLDREIERNYGNENILNDFTLKDYKKTYKKDSRKNSLKNGAVKFNAENIKFNSGNVEFIEGDFSIIGDKIKELKERYSYENRDFLILSNSKNSCDYIKLVSDFEIRKEMDFFKGSNYEYLEENIVLATYQCSKAFERKVVFLTNVDKIYGGKAATEKFKRKILYVGITRASEKLYIAESSGEKGKFFKELKLC